MGCECKKQRPEVREGLWEHQQEFHDVLSEMAGAEFNDRRWELHWKEQLQGVLSGLRSHRTRFCLWKKALAPWYGKMGVRDKRRRDHQLEGQFEHHATFAEVLADVEKRDKPANVGKGVGTTEVAELVELVEVNGMAEVATGDVSEADAEADEVDGMAEVAEVAEVADVTATSKGKNAQLVPCWFASSWAVTRKPTPRCMWRPITNAGESRKTWDPGWRWVMGTLRVRRVSAAINVKLGRQDVTWAKSLGGRPGPKSTKDEEPGASGLRSPARQSKWAPSVDEKRAPCRVRSVLSAERAPAGDIEGARRRLFV